MKENNLYQLLKNHLPENAVHYAYDLWAVHGFTFKVTNKRKSKYGDYRFDPSLNTHTITVNGDLNPYAFLVTYIHEVAHLVVYQTKRKKLAPHGKEWKRSFQLLMAPMLSNLVFPENILLPLRRYMMNPKATSSSDPRLSIALRSYDDNVGLIALGEVKPGETFKFNSRLFQKESKRRTRIVCLEVKSGRKYLISQVAMVERLEHDPLDKATLTEEKSFC